MKLELINDQGYCVGTYEILPHHTAEEIGNFIINQTNMKEIEEVVTEDFLEERKPESLSTEEKFTLLKNVLNTFQADIQNPMHQNLREELERCFNNIHTELSKMEGFLNLKAKLIEESQEKLEDFQEEFNESKLVQNRRGQIDLYVLEESINDSHSAMETILSDISEHKELMQRIMGDQDTELLEIYSNLEDLENEVGDYSEKLNDCASLFSDLHYKLNELC